jgi:hypothetical protein
MQSLRACMKRGFAALKIILSASVGVCTCQVAALATPGLRLNYLWRTQPLSASGGRNAQPEFPVSNKSHAKPPGKPITGILGTGLLLYLCSSAFICVPLKPVTRNA